MNSPEKYFLNTIDWLKNSYSQFTFFVERDVVWTFQTYLISIIQEETDYSVFNDFGVLPGKRRKLSSDLAIIDASNRIRVAVEFKYEPSHNRIDIPKEKFPVVFWGKEGVAKDIKRIHRFVEEAMVDHAYSIFIDEGGYFRHRSPHPGSSWLQWSQNIWVLWAEVHRK